MRIRPLFLLLTIFTLFVWRAAYGDDLAIIVNKENPTDNLSRGDLIKFFRQEKQYWQGGQKVYLIMQEAGSPEKDLVLEKIFKMEDEALKKFWLTKMFRGEIASFPNTLGSNEAVKRFISRVPNTIGFVDASFADESVKVLRIDGKLPGEKGYLLEDLKNSPGPATR